MSCPCDTREHPRELRFEAGLDELPRQVATFPEFRAAMLSAIRAEPALVDWRARHQGDLGVMLLELWAYVCDALAFYDEVIAHESYVRTARLRPSLRKLVGLLGYVPRPAVGAGVRLAIVAGGRAPVRLPRGTAFRAGAFDSQPPQVYELDADERVHPLLSRWDLEAPRPSALVAADPGWLLLEPRSVRLEAGDPVVVRVAGSTAAGQVRRAAALDPHVGADGDRYARLGLAAALTLAAGTPLASIQIARPTREASLWSIVTANNPAAIQNVSGSQPTSLTLDGLYREIKPGTDVVLEKAGELRWFRVTQVAEAMLEASAAGTTTVGTTTIAVPAIKVPTTRLTLDATLNQRVASPAWAATDAPSIVVRHGVVPAGSVVAEARTAVGPADPLRLAEPVEAPPDGSAPEAFLVSDRDERGLELSGAVDVATRTLTPDGGTTWSPDLPLPVRVRGNVVTATRGQTVPREVLGTGDASVPGQRFKLAQKPLTYLPAAGAPSGVASTLVIHVDGVRWDEVPSFFGAPPDANVYVVRQDDAGDSTVAFGDNVRGARLPTGSAVVAGYRFGAGATTPPAGSITQLGGALPGVTAVENPVAASGGADAEPAAELRTYAPRSALLLGRAVSVADMEAVAAGVPGVRAVRAEWRWHAGRQRPLVQVWYVGPPGLEPKVVARLRAVSDPSVPIAVDPATPVPTALIADLELDPRRVPGPVLEGARAALLDPARGLVAPERVGIGTPLYRSRVLAALDGVEGVLSVRGVSLGGAPFTAFAVAPGAGNYFDFSGSLSVTGSARSSV
jgi:predicted phage baseplate assembly protein